MSTELTAEQRAGLGERWEAAAVALMPKLGAFAATLDPDEQGVPAYLLREALGEREDTAGFFSSIGRALLLYHQAQHTPPPPRPKPAAAYSGTVTPWRP